MDSWHPLVAAIFGFVLTILGVTYQQEKKRNEASVKMLVDQNFILANKVTKLESTSVTEHVMAEGFKALQKDINKLSLQIAKLPKEVTHAS